MVVRVLPASKGGIYSNTGSSNVLIHYLEHEAHEEGREDRAIFFDGVGEGITAGEVEERIGGNIQGLQKGKPHFHSLVISPSQEELRHVHDDPKKLQEFTRQVMENYAANFSDKRQRPLKSEDLVWYATLHRSRHYSGLDDAVQEGRAQKRQPKDGVQTHIHVIVSARDRTMSRSLHPDAGSRRFNYRNWLAKNEADFGRMYGYQKTKTGEDHEKRLGRIVERMNRVGLALDGDKMKVMGQERQYDRPFWKGVSQVEKGFKQGNIFTPNQAYERLKETSSNHQAEAKPISHNQASAEKDKDPKKSVGRTDLSPLLNALKFESVPETGEHARTQDDDFRRKRRRR